jgi:hypothetical protein
VKGRDDPLPVWRPVEKNRRKASSVMINLVVKIKCRVSVL